MPQNDPNSVPGTHLPRAKPARDCSPDSRDRQSRPPDLRWLARYAKHCGFFEFQSGRVIDGESAFREAFGAPAWRLLCRSPRERFLPIVRSQDLSIESLIDYCQNLVQNSFLVAPRAKLLDFFVTQRRTFYNDPCRIPRDQDYLLMRIAERCPQLRMAEVALVANWVQQSNFALRLQHQWHALVKRAKAYREAERVSLRSRSAAGWHFHCDRTDWRGYHINPITNSADLWLEGLTQGNCLYRLRSECSAKQPSRFFSVTRNAKRVATLELGWRAPKEEFIGMDRELGRWQLQDVRLAFNRVPEPALVGDMQAFAQMYNLWAKRPRRMPPGHLDDLRRRIAWVNGTPLGAPWRPHFGAVPQASGDLFTATG